MPKRPRAGRPPKFSPDFVEIASRMREMNMPVRVIARTLGVNLRTTWRWRQKYELFGSVMKASHARPRDFAMRRA
jgi:transposase-like protein